MPSEEVAADQTKVCTRRAMLKRNGGSHRQAEMDMTPRAGDGLEALGMVCVPGHISWRARAGC